MRYWKVKLTGHSTAFGAVELRVCEEAETMDAAIAQARKGAGAAFNTGFASAAAQTLSTQEMTDPIRAERIFVDSGDFNAYLREWAA